jgi:hypothetical protein
MTRSYEVLHGFRVGKNQQWRMPKDEVQLLPCEAQYPLSRGWLKPIKETVKNPVESTENSQVNKES